MKALFFLILLTVGLHATDEFLGEKSDIQLPSLVEDNFITSPELLGSSLPCRICSKAMSFIVGRITKHGCGLVTKVLMAAACEAAGLGPEDPLSDTCVVLLLKACSRIAKLIADHIKDPTQLCHKVHICK